MVLFQPDIPQNTGNVGRLCAITNSRLHLIHPLGFEISDRTLRRAGMDYWRSLDVHEHSTWQSFRLSDKAPRRLWLFTTRATRSFWDVGFSQSDGLLFGKETAGCPDWLHDEIGEAQRICIPRLNQTLRSINLATCVGIAVYEALRQITGAEKTPPP
mgnify:CR=1 FL=1